MEASRLRGKGARFLESGVLHADLLPWLWRGLPAINDSPGLVAELLLLLQQLAVALPWHADADDGRPQWLVPLRLPTARPALPAGWAVEDAASEVCRVYDFGGDVPTGLVAALLNAASSWLSVASR